MIKRVPDSTIKILVNERTALHLTKQLAADVMDARQYNEELQADLLETRAELAKWGDKEKERYELIISATGCSSIEYLIKEYKDTKASLSALQEQVRFKSMNVFKPKEDLLQDYLVIYDDDEIAVATYMNAANPEDCFWYAGSEINNIRPYGWMELPLPLPPEEK